MTTKYNVLSFEHEIRDNGKGCDNLFIACTLKNPAGNSSARKYRIWNDTNWPDLNGLTSIIVKGMTRARDGHLRIGLSEYAERSYLFLDLPADDDIQQIKVSAERE